MANDKIAGEVVYSVKFRPSKFRYREAVRAPGPGNGATNVLRYFEIIDLSRNLYIGWVFEEEIAKQICFALDLATAQLAGDRRETKALLAALGLLQ